MKTATAIVSKNKTKRLTFDEYRPIIIIFCLKIGYNRIYFSSFSHFRSFYWCESPRDFMGAYYSH
jgi:hypothetical protein